MSDSILQSVANDLGATNEQIEQAEELISVMKEAGEPVGELEAELINLKRRKEKWQQVLEQRGYSG